MKKLKAIFIISIGLMLGSGCNDWLYLEPEDGIIRQEYWMSKEDVHACLMGCYASLLGNTGSGQGYSVPELLFLWGEIRADMVSLNRSNPDFQYIIYGDILQDNQICRWNAFYRTINFCNTVLEFGPAVLEVDPSFTEESLRIYQAEARALRALMYLYLLKTFDEVPVKLTATKDDSEEFNIPKSSRSEIMEQIKTDLEWAEQHAPVTHGSLAADKGRITRYAVNAIQADLFIWSDQYESCITACDKIINSGFYGLLESNDFWFTDLYVDGNSTESIFELQFSPEVLNPYYRLFKERKYLRANAASIEEFFPSDPNALPDSADIRADGCSYKLSDNFTIWKYVGRNREEAKPSNESFSNFIIYRFAEILLFKAEALSQLGRNDEALQLVRMIRKRAHAAKASDMGQANDTRSVTEFILSERCREFAYEGKRWFDILRIAKRNHYENLDLIIEMVTRSAPAEKMLTVQNKYRDTLSHYFPIYYLELQANPALEQNNFYKEAIY
ncbi:MAG: RagB/SusD family nutrient uptake outer membrane protein [Bacteroidales bacterium]|nr:RagB/SusD family nutrient uptake outer membrane protein [Bacteroidales bacterium]MBN2697193.1 RagB/SusD family nutrient uptake outer membrane protein [Bacteroidales bacterium]